MNIDLHPLARADHLGRRRDVARAAVSAHSRKCPAAAQRLRAVARDPRAASTATSSRPAWAIAPACWARLALAQQVLALAAVDCPRPNNRRPDHARLPIRHVRRRVALPHLAEARRTRLEPTLMRTAHRLGCTPSDHPNIGRRRLLEAGGLSLFGLGLADLLRVEAQAATAAAARATAKSVVFIFQSGGPSQHETWDPKPQAPAEIRGDYGTTATRHQRLSHLRVPAEAGRADRSVFDRPHDAPSGGAAVSQRAQRRRCTWCRPAAASCRRAKRRRPSHLPKPRRFEWPSIGSAIAYALPDGASLRSAAGRRDCRGQIANARHRTRHAGQQVRPLARRPGAAVPHARRRRIVPQLLCPRSAATIRPARRASSPAPGGTTASCRNPDFHLPDLGLSTGLSRRQPAKSRGAVGRTRPARAASSTPSPRCATWTSIAARPGT